MKSLNSRKNLSIKYSNGLSLLDVLLAIVIFAVGMLALAQIQSHLSKSSADSGYRTLATNLGEETLERLRAFQLVRSDPEGNLFAFADIDANYLARSETLGNVGDEGGVSFDISGTVKGFDINDDGVTFTETDPAVAGAVYDFKLVELTVSWNAGPSFQVAENSSLSQAELGTGSVSLTGVVPSIPALASAKVNSDADADGGPPVNYSPGLRPDIIPIELGGQKFKESTTPEPVVRRDFMETWFDVVTYSQAKDQNGAEAIFLRREEFVTISCECELNSRPAGSTVTTGFPPAIWTGATYKVGDDGEMVNKEYGVQHSTGVEQSLYCDTCCRDHHDSGTGYRFKPAYTGAGNHPHYSRDNQGNFVLVQAGVKGKNTYVEACRLVRKDGFFRVAQDLDLYEHNAFPEYYLNSPAEIADYSAYVAAVVESELASGGSPPGTAQSNLAYMGEDQNTRLAVLADQQLRSRGIYVDESNAELEANIKNCFGSGDRSLCEAPKAGSALELYPFFDIQVTRLARWDETFKDNPVHISNDEIPLNRNQDYSRGLAELAGSKVGGATGHSTIEMGNVGLISTLPIAPVPASVYDQSDIYLMAGGSSLPPANPGYPVISGSLSAETSTSNAADLIVSGSSGVLCSKPDNQTFECLVDPVYSTATLTVSNYYNPTVELIICNAGGLSYQSHVNGDQITNRTVFSISPVDDIAGIVFTIVPGTSTAACVPASP